MNTVIEIEAQCQDLLEHLNAFDWSPFIEDREKWNQMMDNYFGIVVKRLQTVN